MVAMAPPTALPAMPAALNARRGDDFESSGVADVVSVTLDRAWSCEAAREVDRELMAGPFGLAPLRGRLVETSDPPVDDCSTERRGSVA